MPACCNIVMLAAHAVTRRMGSMSAGCQYASKRSYHQSCTSKERSAV